MNGNKKPTLNTEIKITREQEDIINAEGNVIVTADAGTGKTFTLLTKISADMNNYYGHKVPAALTFTHKVAAEIKSRMKNGEGYFIGTNDSFALNEIIIPFFYDAFSIDWDDSINSDYSKAYSFSCFSEGVNQIKVKRILGTYIDNGKNFTFELALYIMKHSQACRDYLKARYYKLYIDEYQDCDGDMIKLFMNIEHNLGIPLFLVGDVKQSIYMWRGAKPRYFLNLCKYENFLFFDLTVNHRSTQEIQNYANLFAEDKWSSIIPGGKVSNVILLHASDWPEKLKSIIDFKKGSAILRYSNPNVTFSVEKMAQVGENFIGIRRPSINDIQPERRWLFNIIVKCALSSDYSIYDFMNDCPLELDQDQLRQIWIKLSQFRGNRGAVTESAIRKVAALCSVAFSEDDYGKVCESMMPPECNAFFSYPDCTNLAMTLFLAKGLEFNQVIIFLSDFGNYRGKSIAEDVLFKHYVAATRAKNKLVIIDTQDTASRMWLEYMDEILRKNGLQRKNILKEVW